MQMCKRSKVSVIGEVMYVVVTTALLYPAANGSHPSLPLIVSPPLVTATMETVVTCSLVVWPLQHCAVLLYQVIVS